MSSLSNILNYIKTKGYSKTDWEQVAGVGNGTFYNYYKRGADLSAESIDKLSKTFGEELKMAGYHIINVDPFGGEVLAILNEDEMNMLRQNKSALVSDGNEQRGIDFEAKYFEVAERERITLRDDKSFLQELIRANLTLVLAMARTISARQIGAGKVMLGALERLEGKSPGTLEKEADKEIGQIEREAFAHGSAAPTGR